MRRVKIKEIATERELQAFLLDLERRLRKASDIKSSKERLQQVIGVRNEARQLLAVFEKLRRQAEGEERGFFSRSLKVVSRWLTSMERRYV